MYFLGIKATFPIELETCYQTEEGGEQRIWTRCFTYIISFKQACSEFLRENDKEGQEGHKLIILGKDTYIWKENG